MVEISQKKNIILVGSDSGLAQSLIDSILSKSDILTTVSRNKHPSYRSHEHFHVDLSITEQIAEFTKQIESRKYDTLIYLPGIFNPKEIVNVENKKIIEEVTVNLTAAIMVSRAIIPNMIKAKCGTLLYLGSSSSYTGFKNTSVYCSTKHGLLGFTRALSDELRPFGIKVSCISPGSINTKMSIKLHNQQDPETFIDPLEISNLLLNLIYDQNKSMWQEEIILKRRKY